MVINSSVKVARDHKKTTETQLKDDKRLGEDNCYFLETFPRSSRLTAHGKDHNFSCDENPLKNLKMARVSVGEDCLLFGP